MRFRVECRAMNLTEVLRCPEGKTLEFKRDLSSPDGAVKTVVAFANTAGGIVVIGVQDKTRHVVGVPKPREMEERIASLISDSIAPRLVPDLQVLSWRNRSVVAVEVFPSPIRPHHVVREGEARGTYVRVGSTNRRADAALTLELRRVAYGQCFDEQPMPELNSEAIDFRAASESLASSRRLERHDLLSLGLVTRYQGRRVPTVGGILLFSRERLRSFPDAWIQVGRFGGTDRARILDHAELVGYPHVATEQAVTFIREHMRRAAEIGPLRRKDVWELPPEAVREAIVNAVVHSDYSQQGAPIRVALYDNRLEVENPGLLPFGLTVEDITRGLSRLRNRVIGRVFHELNLIEQWGSGIPRMMRACRDAGLPDPAFEEIGFRFRVTLFSIRASRPAFDDLDGRILDLLRDGEGWGTAQLAQVAGISTRAMRSRLARLVERGFVSVVGSGPRDPRRRYYSWRADSRREQTDPGSAT